MNLESRIMINILVIGMAFASRIPGDNLDTGLQNAGFYQGDIAGVFPNSFRAAIPNSKRLWSNRTVTYSIGSSVEHLRKMILDAMEEIQTHTCLSFRDSLPKEGEDHVLITRKDGCWSHMGRQGGEQKLSLGVQCESKGIILHELLHSLGMGHEHTRSDRDDYVEVIWENIKPEKIGNFKELNPWENNLLGERFDFKSVMMYGSLAFSKDAESVTLVSKKDPYQRLPDVAQKKSLSDGDIKKINKLYECYGEERPPHPNVPPFYCSFESSNCGLLNQEEIGLARWVQKKGKSDFLLGDHTTGKGSYMAVLSSETDGLTARLISKSFDAFERDSGCLQFALHFSGDGSESFKLFLQTDYIMEELLSVYEPTPLQWKSYSINVDIKTGFRFFFEANTWEFVHDGVIAIDDVSFTWKQC